MTKRLLSILVAVLMVMALIPMSALAAEARKDGSTPVAKVTAPQENKMGLINFDFEYASEDELDWTLIDADGDGLDWMWLGYGVNYSYESAYEGIGLLSSASYNSYYGALTPDNWAITPAVEVPAEATTLSFWVNAQDPSWSDEHYAVYAGAQPTVAAMTEIMPESVATGDWVKKTIDITAYAGQTVYFGFRHFNVTDMFRINLDLVQICDDEPEPTPTPVPTPVPTPEPEPLNELDAALNIEGGWLRFETSEQYPWIVMEDGSRVYGQSGNKGVHNSTSTISLTVDAYPDATISFDFKAWGDSSSYTGTIYDYCSFIDNGEVVKEWGAYDNTEWERFTYVLSEGEHVLTWSYAKDGSVSMAGDYFAIDDVELINEEPVVAPAQLYAICSFDLEDFYKSATDQWVTFTAEDPGTVTNLGAAPSAYAGAYAYGNVYGMTTEGEMFVAPIDNLANYTLVPSNLPEGLTVTSMTYDYTRNAMYGVASDDSYSYLVGVDISTGAVQVIGTLEGDAFCMAADENGTIYVLDFYDGMKILNPDTLEITDLGDTGVDCSYVQDIAYDFNTGILYWAQLDGDLNADLYTIDTTTGKATKIGRTGQYGLELVSMFIIPEEEPAPAANIPVTGITVTPEEVEIHVGDTIQLTAIVSPFNATNKNVEWDVDDDSIIAVDQDGVVMGLEEGTAMVFATTEDGSYTGYAVVNVLPPIGGLVKGFYFENSPYTEGWQFIDKDGDGFNWDWDNGSLGLTAYEGSGLIYSESYSNDYYSALYPDNWAITPAITLPGGTATVTLYACGQDPSWAAEHFGIFVGTSADPNSMVQVGADVVVNGNYQQFEFNLDEYVGKTIYIAIRHYNVSDMYILNIDQVQIWGDEGGAQQHLWGDANGDGVVDTIDVLLVMRHVQGIITLDAENLPWLDVNADGTVNFADALLIARKVMNIIPAFPVEL